MRSLAKILIAAAVAAPLVFAGYQAREADKLQAENRNLRTTTADIPPSPEPSSHGKARKRGTVARQRPQEPRAATVASIRRQMKMADQGVYEHAQDFSLIERDGRGLSDDAAKAAGLDAAERESVSAILRNIRSDVSEDFTKRTMRVAEESDEDSGRFVYLIPARRDRGQEFKERLLGELENEVGITRLAILLRGLQGDDFLGGFGAQDVRVELVAGKDKLKVAYLDPLTGEDTSSGTRTLEEFKNEFGEPFEIPAGPVSE